jgi:protein-S-isoprenylcysteine O-methyltransferase Ste14
MGARKLSESEGRILKLVSGFMMLGFGVMLLAAPQWLTNPLASILVLVVAVGTALVAAKFAKPQAA